MSHRRDLFVFFIAEQKYAIDLSCVDRVVRACAVTDLALAPPGVMGVIVVHGEVLPVYDPRVRFGLREVPLEPSQQFVLAHTSKRRCCLLVDSAVGIAPCTPVGYFQADELVAGAPEWLSAVQKTVDGIVYIHNLEAFLSPGEEEQLARALEQRKEAS